MPAGIVDQQHDGLLNAGARRLGEGVEDGLEQADGDGAGEPPFDGAAHGVDEGVEVEPFVLVAGAGRRALTDLGPDAPSERLQAEAVLVEGPDLDRPPGRLALRLRHLLAEFFLKAARSSGPAALV